MNADKTDIALIQKYLNGELDAKAMHQLERAAQDDPFLMDALEGYQEIGKQQTANLNDIKARFAERLEEPKQRNVVLWRVLPIAASVLIVATVGLLWYSPGKQESPAKVALNKVADTNAIVSQNKAVQPPVQTEQLVASNSNRSSIQANQQKKNTAVSNGQTYSNVVEKHPVKPVDSQKTSLSEMLANRVQSLDIITRVADAPTADNKTFTGTVTDATGHALANVKVAVKGTQLTALTDTAGKFTIITSGDGGMLNIVRSGFKSAQVALGGKDSLKVVLNESVSELAEISVSGYSEDKPMGLAHPLQGWKAFKDYIKKNAFMPDGETGRVKLAFSVTANGSIKGVRVIRGKSDAMNQKAIALLVDGPEWSSQNDTKEIKIRIRFRKLKGA